MAQPKTNDPTPLVALKDVVVPKVAPFGTPLLWGAKKTGKTLASLNSPWQKVHVIDVENSTIDYFQHQDRLIKMGILRGPFTAAYCYTMNAYLDEVKRIQESKERYGTIVLDTFGQISSWIGEAEFAKMGDRADKQTQIAWGKTRDRLRNHMLELRKKCDFLILTAHEREYPPMSKKFSPRCNPSALELASFSIRLTRADNVAIPDADMKGARLPFFPPKIEKFDFMKLLQYTEQPADWNNLKDTEKAVPTEVAAVTAPTGYSEDREMMEA